MDNQPRHGITGDGQACRGVRMCIEAGAACAEERAQGMACVDGGMYVGGQTLRGQEASVLWLWGMSSCGCGSRRSSSFGGCMWVTANWQRRREVGRFAGRKSWEIVKFIGMSRFAERVGRECRQADFEDLQRRVDLG